MVHPYLSFFLLLFSIPMLFELQCKDGKQGAKDDCLQGSIYFPVWLMGKKKAAHAGSYSL
jgi:hypothetical protein